MILGFFVDLKNWGMLLDYQRVAWFKYDEEKLESM